ncbi:MAG: Bax inhibitor-1/YccA family protein [Bacteroidetes bacterium]|nr:Bax inhibitor-1/YccA family protein [Bacteroidota bacterium]
MSEYNNNYYAADATRVFFRSVYTYMFGALAISGILAYVVGTNLDYFSKLFIAADGGISITFWVVIFSPLLISIAIQWGVERFSMGTLTLLFIAYSALMGLSLSTIFIAFPMGDIIRTFFVSAGAFGGMAFLGYTTKVDLTKFGSLLYMLLIGMIIASIVNMFTKSGEFDFIISCIGVFVFTGLTAYQMQQLKAVSQQGLSGERMQKMSLIGGLQLYILFINLFLSLLRLLGGRD